MRSALALEAGTKICEAITVCVIRPIGFNVPERCYSRLNPNQYVAATKPGDPDSLATISIPIKGKLDYAILNRDETKLCMEKELRSAGFFLDKMYGKVSTVYVDEFDSTVLWYAVVAFLLMIFFISINRWQLVAKETKRAQETRELRAVKSEPADEAELQSLREQSLNAI